MIRRLCARLAVWLCRTANHRASINRRRAMCVDCGYHYALED